MTGTFPGHSVLQVPVAPLEAWVRERTEFYDPAYLSDDPRFGHAHVTALGPFLDELDQASAATVAAIAAGTAPFDFSLEQVATFPNGIIHLLPEPSQPFRTLTARLVAAFPGCPPYGGQFPHPVPHLTLDAVSAQVSEESTRRAVGALLPARCRAERLDLVWYEPGVCRVLRTWPLAGAAQNS